LILFHVGEKIKHVVTDKYDESAHMEGHDVGVKGIINLAHQIGEIYK
jgi:hypothetical protein